MLGISVKLTAIVFLGAYFANLADFSIMVSLGTSSKRDWDKVHCFVFKRIKLRGISVLLR